jgi:two-component system, NtrC family, sensor kinase
MPEASTFHSGLSDEDFRERLADAHRRETATAEILRIIGSSPAKTQPVFEAIAKHAVLLCEATWGGVFAFDGTLTHFIAGYGLSEDVTRHLRDEYPIAPMGINRLAITGRALVHVVDALNDSRVANVELVRKLAYRSHLVMPMMRNGQVVGTIHVYGPQPKPFSDAQISLLQTFADQAVIAIENARLFEEVQEKNRALTAAHTQMSGALERETATSEILHVIGRSPTDVQPVFNTIARSGVNVCVALGCVVLVVDRDLIRVAATHGVRPERLEAFHRDYPIALSAETDTAQTIRHRTIFHMADIENNPKATATDIEHARLAGYRTRLMVPMVRGDRTLGLIAVTREDPRPISDEHIELLKTFADQAVIAIENARLFEAEQASKRELQESLEYQTAISEVLAVTSRSPSELQPVFDTIVAAAERLCQADRAQIFILKEQAYHLAAHTNTDERVVTHFLANPLVPSRRTATERALLEGATIHVADVTLDRDYDQDGFHATLGGSRLAVPLLSGGRTIGVIALPRMQPMPTSRRHSPTKRSLPSRTLASSRLSRRANGSFKKHSNTRPRLVRCLK